MEDYSRKIRSMYIIANDGETVKQTLENADLGDWEISKTGFAAPAHQDCFRRGDEVIAIPDSYASSDRVLTSNVLPYDNEHDSAAANALLKELGDVLRRADVNISITASDEDLEN
ncbi:hypothetical protein ABMA58_08315 [Oceanospirillum sp. HFRX-1_2]